MAISHFPALGPKLHWTFILGITWPSAYCKWFTHVCNCVWAKANLFVLAFLSDPKHEYPGGKYSVAHGSLTRTCEHNLRFLSHCLASPPVRTALLLIMPGTSHATVNCLTRIPLRMLTIFFSTITIFMWQGHLHDWNEEMESKLS